MHNGDVSLRIIKTSQVSMHKVKNFKDTMAHTIQHPVRWMLIKITSRHRQLPEALFSLRYEVSTLMHFWLCLHDKNLFKKYQKNVYNFTDTSEFWYTGKEIISEENGFCSHTNISYSSGHRIVWIYITSTQHTYIKYFKTHNPFIYTSVFHYTLFHLLHNVLFSQYLFKGNETYSHFT